jgi:hypothetical protein
MCQLFTPTRGSLARVLLLVTVSAAVLGVGEVTSVAAASSSRTWSRPLRFGHRAALLASSINSSGHSVVLWSAKGRVRATTLTRSGRRGATHLLGPEPEFASVAIAPNGSAAAVLRYRRRILTVFLPATGRQPRRQVLGLPSGSRLSFEQASVAADPLGGFVTLVGVTEPPDLSHADHALAVPIDSAGRVGQVVDIGEGLFGQSVPPVSLTIDDSGTASVALTGLPDSYRLPAASSRLRLFQRSHGGTWRESPVAADFIDSGVVAARLQTGSGGLGLAGLVFTAPGDPEMFGDPVGGVQQQGARGMRLARMGSAHPGLTYGSWLVPTGPHSGVLIFQRRRPGRVTELAPVFESTLRGERLGTERRLTRRSVSAVQARPLVGGRALVSYCDRARLHTLQIDLHGTVKPTNAPQGHTDCTHELSTSGRYALEAYGRPGNIYAAVRAF